jgi:hypothetical protein
MSDTMWVKKSRVSASACHRAAHSSRKQHACCDVATDFVRNNFIRGYAGSMPAMTSIHSVTLGLLQLRLRYIPLCWPCICHAYATSHGIHFVLAPFALHLPDSSWLRCGARVRIWIVWQLLREKNAPCGKCAYSYAVSFGNVA